jgi:hypothetical protein
MAIANADAAQRISKSGLGKASLAGDGGLADICYQPHASGPKVRQKIFERSALITGGEDRHKHEYATEPASKLPQLDNL